MNHKFDLFISYSRKDTPEVDKLCRILDKVGISYFIDRQNISGGMEFPVAIAESILQSRLFLLFASENAYKSKFTTNELTYAYSKKASYEIVVYRLDDSPMPPGFEMATNGVLKYDRECSIESDLVIGLYTELHNGEMPDDNHSVKIALMLKKEDKFNDYVNWILTPAHNGHANACFYLGGDFITDKSENNVLSALGFLNTAADKGIVEALLLLGSAYEVGVEYIEASPEKALEYYRRAALTDTRGDGQYDYGRCLLEGIGTAPDVAKAEKWLRKAVENGNKDARDLLDDPRFSFKTDKQFDDFMREFIDSQLADTNTRLYDFIKDTDMPKALYHLHEAAVLGNVDAMHRYGREALSTAPKEAMRILSKLAEKGYHDDTLFLADTLMSQDRLFEALAFYLRVREVGNELLDDNHPVINAISLKYSETEIAERKDLFFEEENIPASAQLMKMLADRGDYNCTIDLGCLYISDNGLKRDLNKAAEYLKTGVNRGDVFAISTLASIYDGVFGNEPDRAKAFRLFALAAGADDPASMFRYGQYLVEGLAGVTDTAEGVIWIRRAAENNIVDAQFYMYELCKNGIVDRDDADKWLSIAAENGHLTAQIIKKL